MPTLNIELTDNIFAKLESEAKKAGMPAPEFAAAAIRAKLAKKAPKSSKPLEGEEFYTKNRDVFA